MIYFVQETGWFRNRVKIGITDNIKQRLAALRSLSPSNLKLKLVFPGGIETEAIYHERFADYRLHGEWFRCNLKLRLFMLFNTHKSVLLDDTTEKEKEQYEEMKINEAVKEKEYRLAVVDRFKDYIESLEGKKPVWRRATQFSFDNETMYGTFYSDKLKLILSNAEIEYEKVFANKASN